MDIIGKINININIIVLRKYRIQFKLQSLGQSTVGSFISIFSVSSISSPHLAQTRSRTKMGNDHPDSELFPHATGTAEQMVKAHQKEEPLKIYSGWFCPFDQLVLLVLLEKKIPFQYIEVNHFPLQYTNSF